MSRLSSLIHARDGLAQLQISGVSKSRVASPVRVVGLLTIKYTCCGLLIIGVMVDFQFATNSVKHKKSRNKSIFGVDNACNVIKLKKNNDKQIYESISLQFLGIFKFSDRTTPKENDIKEQRNRCKSAYTRLPLKHAPLKYQ